MNKFYNLLLNATDFKKIWLMYDVNIKKFIIKQIFNNNNKNNLAIAIKILKLYIDSDPFRDIDARYINLLCIALARSHDPKYIKDIILTKMTGDLFFYIDSNLLFEFSPKKCRKTCIKDTIDHYNDISINEKWLKYYKEYILYYSKSYSEDLVIKYWNRYKSKEYLEMISYY